jgi:hypothetical protein
MLAVTFAAFSALAGEATAQTSTNSILFPSGLTFDGTHDAGNTKMSYLP